MNLRTACFAFVCAKAEKKVEIDFFFEINKQILFKFNSITYTHLVMKMQTKNKRILFLRILEMKNRQIIINN